MTKVKLSKRGRYTYALIGRKGIKCASRAWGGKLVEALDGWGPVSTPPKAPAIRKVAPFIEDTARYLIRGFHDDFLDPRYYLEPGFRRLVGQKEKIISVYYEDLREDWQDDCRRALDKWEAERLGFEFRVVGTKETADILIDDEEPGAYANRTFRLVGGKKDGRHIIHVSSRNINISKRWREWHMPHAMLHEFGHQLGLGHAGNYNGSGRHERRSKGDDLKYTCMSYHGRVTGSVGDADKVALEMNYS